MYMVTRRLATRPEIAVCYLPNPHAIKTILALAVNQVQESQRIQSDKQIAQARRIDELQQFTTTSRIMASRSTLATTPSPIDTNSVVGIKYDRSIQDLNLAARTALGDVEQVIIPDTNLLIDQPRPIYRTWREWRGWRVP